MNKLISKIRNSLISKIFLGITTVLIAVCLLIFVSLRILMPTAFENEQSTQLITNLQSLLTQLEASSPNDFDTYITSFAIENSANVFISDENGNTISSVNVSKGNDDSSQGRGTITGATSFLNNGKTYYIEAGIAGNAVDQITGTFVRIFPYILIIIIFISALAAFLYARILAKPIVDISHISRKMTALDMTWRCDIKRSDEIGVLADSLNQMAASLDNALTELRTANEKLQEDIEWERRQEKQRKDFFAAISHELKTPVAVLKGELEGMICNVGKFKDRDTYLQEAFETAESIEKLVKEIMSLAKMNMDEMKLHLQDILLNDLVTDCLKAYEEPAAAKQITVRQNFEDELLCYADYMNLKKAVSNIIGNAVHHSPEKAFIDITIRKSGDKGILMIENSGVHVSQEEIERVFEPFYRIDKSRSRHTGGSGLGLHIVKTILDMHGFEYSLENTDTGVKFTMIFP
ncbi:MAG: ATP-binding protein [Lachnospiraceae bacterium]